ncbi:MAG: DUF3160 domain-containing protein, partial [Lachnospiraceae bacterium]|nr:DUF3160 domain-containing protein [Lachnospiraceae bacterium]
MKRKRIKGILAIVLVISILCACAGTERESGTQNAPVEAENVKEGETQEENVESADKEADNTAPDSAAYAGAPDSDDDDTDMETLSPEELEALLADIKPINRPFTGDRPFLVKSGDEQAVDMAVPSVEAYTVAPDLSNVDNLWQFYLQDGFKAQLAENGFVVFGEAGFEFYEVYENNRYNQIANFVTVDSMMHTYHLYFAYLMKNVEKEYLYAYLTLLSRKMLESSVGQYALLKGSEWEEAAMRNVAFFTIGATLLGDRAEVPDYVEEIVSYELDAIGQAEGIKESKITGEYEDYTQYKPRGY